MNEEPESQLVNVYGDHLAKERKHALVAYQRMIHTRVVSFVCAGCGQPVTQQRYPSRGPKYCSEACQKVGQRLHTRQRVKKLRDRRRSEQNKAESL